MHALALGTMAIATGMVGASMPVVRNHSVGGITNADSGAVGLYATSSHTTNQAEQLFRFQRLAQRDVTSLGLIRQSTNIPRCRLQVLKGPLEGRAHIVPDVHKPGGIRGRQRYLELNQRKM